MQIKGLSIRQPWAQMLALGLKELETRHWDTNYRGLVAIHASKKFDKRFRDMCGEYPFEGIDADNLPLGKIIAVAKLQATIPTDAINPYDLPNPQEYSLGDFSEGRFAWSFMSPVLLEKPLGFRGSLGLWGLPETLEKKLIEAWQNGK